MYLSHLDKKRYSVTPLQHRDQQGNPVCTCLPWRLWSLLSKKVTLNLPGYIFIIAIFIFNELGIVGKQRRDVLSLPSDYLSDSPGFQTNSGDVSCKAAQKAISALYGCFWEIQLPLSRSFAHCCQWSVGQDPASKWSSSSAHAVCPASQVTPFPTHSFPSCRQISKQYKALLHHISVSVWSWGKGKGIKAVHSQSNLSAHAGGRSRKTWGHTNPAWCLSRVSYSNVLAQARISIFIKSPHPHKWHLLSVPLRWKKPG